MIGRDETRLIRVVGFALLALTACSVTAEPGACYRDRDGACVEFTKEQSTAGQKLCKGMRWIAGADACPKEGRLGTCVKDRGAVVEHMYGGPPNNFTAGAAKLACESGSGAFAAR